jgi:hypothetical protein
MASKERTGFCTEIEFTLPKGYLDDDGVLHRSGVMRLATAADEILPLKDPRVQQNPAYLTVIVLARVILKLGSVADITTRVIEGLFASDLGYLQKLYEELNGVDAAEPAIQSGPARGNGMLHGERRGTAILGES